MYFSTLYTLAFAGFGLSLLAVAIFKRSAQHNPRGLPGPALIPYVGRIHDLPVTYVWLKFKEWADTYGPIYRTKMFGHNLVVISDESIAQDLLVKRARIYSDRPKMPSLVDSKSTYGTMEYLPLMGMNVYWARQRKYAHALLTEAKTQRYDGIMEFEVKRWLNCLLDDPENFLGHTEDMTSRVACTLAWDDPNSSRFLTKSAWALLKQISPAGTITALLTPLCHLPYYINPWKIAERKRHDELQTWWMDRLVHTQRLMRKGKQRPCFTKTYLETSHRATLSGDYEASSLIGMLALVSIITVAGPLSFFFIAMVHHLEWQNKCQEEVNQQCRGLMPTLADIEKLPTVRACLKETMRWKPTIPTGVPHECEADDCYQGYFLSKGTRILPLDYALLRNPVKYPDPESFRPERWLDPSWPTFQEPLSKYPTLKGMSSFGWGRRECPGQSYTQDEGVLSCAAVVWAFNLKRKTDATTGEDIEVPQARSSSLMIRKPEPFEMVFEPTSSARKAEVFENWSVAEAKDRRKRTSFQESAESKEALR